MIQDQHQVLVQVSPRREPNCACSKLVSHLPPIAKAGARRLLENEGELLQNIFEHFVLDRLHRQVSVNNGATMSEHRRLCG